MFKGFCSLLFLLLLLGLAAAGYVLWSAFALSPDQDAVPVEFRIDAGESAAAVSERLKEQGLISSKAAFEWFLKTFGKDGAIQAGSFLLKEGMSFSDLAKMLSDASADEVRLTLPEGLTIEQIGERVREALPHISPESWRFATGSESPFFQTHTFLSGVRAGGTLEGYLFPDTYRFRKDADAATVVRKMLDVFERKLVLSDTFGEADVHETMTLASIVEREVRSQEAMRNVADIFRKRLDIGMPLQADSTVNYVTGKKDPSATYADLTIDSPYNTYKYRGLPPGPISNPGLQAIKAVLGPAANEWYYFLTTPEGEVKYARTLEEHNENRKFLE